MRSSRSPGAAASCAGGRCGRPERARAILDDLRRERPDSPGLRFGEALLAAAQGDAVAAREWLTAAIDREPLLRAEAVREPLLAPLLGETS
jgi:predicted Zn-dependent protease